MSACDCCDPFPIDVLQVEVKSNFVSMQKCGWPNGIIDLGSGFEGIDCSGDGIYKKVIIESASAIGEMFQFNRDPAYFGEATLYENGTVLEHVREYIYNAEEHACDFFESGFTLEDTPDYTKYTLENEYTTEELLSNAFSKLYDENQWPEEWQEPVSAFENIAGACRDFPVAKARVGRVEYSEGGSYYWVGGIVCDDDDESATANENSSCDAYAAKIRLVHPPTATGYLKVWISKRTKIFNPETLTYTIDSEEELDSYQWQGEPADITVGINEPENKIYSDEFIVVTTEGTKHIDLYVSKISLLPSYEPDDPVVNSELEYIEDFDPFVIGLKARPAGQDCEANGVPKLNDACTFR